MIMRKEDFAGLLRESGYRLDMGRDDERRSSDKHFKEKRADALKVCGKLKEWCKGESYSDEPSGYTVENLFDRQIHQRLLADNGKELLCTIPFGRGSKNKR